MSTAEAALAGVIATPSTAEAAVAGVIAPTPTMAAGFWTHTETAIYLGLPPATLYQLNCKGTGPRSYKIGRHRKYRPADVEAWCEARASEPRPWP